MTLSHRELGALRYRLTHEPAKIPAAEMREIARMVGVEARLVERKLILAGRILDAIGRPFDREAMAALTPTPTMLWSHDAPKGLPRRLRRHAWSTKTISRFEKVDVRRTIPARYRRPALFVPATLRDLMLARVELAKASR